MVGMHGRDVVRVLGTVCIGATLLAGGSSPIAAKASTTAMNPAVRTAERTHVLARIQEPPQPGDQFGLTKAEQDYLYGPRDTGESGRPGPHVPRGPFPK